MYSSRMRIVLSQCPPPPRPCTPPLPRSPHPLRHARPPGQNDRRLWKHYLSVITVADGKNVGRNCLPFATRDKKLKISQVDDSVFFKRLYVERWTYMTIWTSSNCHYSDSNIDSVKMHKDALSMSNITCYYQHISTCECKTSRDIESSVTWEQFAWIMAAVTAI